MRMRIYTSLQRSNPLMETTMAQASDTRPIIDQDTAHLLLEVAADALYCIKGTDAVLRRAGFPHANPMIAPLEAAIARATGGAA